MKIVTEKSGSLAKIQMETLANDYQMNLSGYYDMAKGLMMDEYVKLFLKQKDRTEPELLKQVGQTIHNNMNVQSNINFMAIINVRTQEYAYKGKLPWHMQVWKVKCRRIIGQEHWQNKEMLF